MVLVCLNEAGIIGAPESLGIWIILRPLLGKVESTNFMTQKMNLHYRTQNYVVLFFLGKYHTHQNSSAKRFGYMTDGGSFCWT